jgi:hypothetical protein
MARLAWLVASESHHCGASHDGCGCRDMRDSKRAQYHRVDANKFDSESEYAYE